MVISAYQVNNVLRVYHDQLRHGKVSSKPVNDMTRYPDQVSISSGGKRKAVIDKITSSIADKISQSGTRNEIGKEELRELEGEFGVQLDVSQDDSTNLVYKMIDGHGETINLLTIEDVRNSESFGI
ncbi:MAG: hypothetical protein EHM85_14365 [Desulfobacteraceae bacterium]|nr:MAG: hypothetical protein EHM85_14365 [Desulfobacteraceae bacterium]